MQQRHTLAFKGFTLIELALAIVIFGILAATALPRFFSTVTAAKASFAQGTKGKMAAAIGIVHAAWIAAGAPATASTITVDGQTIHVNANGWPDSANSTGSIGMGPTTPCQYPCGGTVQNFAGYCAAFMQNLIPDSPQTVSSQNQCTETPCWDAGWSGNAAGVCSYKVNTANGSYDGDQPTINYNIITGQIGVCTSGSCTSYYTP